MTEPYILYGAEPSYYTAKARSYLRKKGIPFVERSSGHPRYREVVKISGQGKIPILEAPDGTVVQDTTDIIDFLEARFAEKPAYPTTPKQRLVALLFELFGDECMLKPAMHYRWNFPDDNFPFIFREFGRIFLPQLPMDEASEMARPVADKMAGYLPVLGITEETIPEIEASYETLLDLLNEHFRFHPYLLGGRPCLADYGMVGPMYAHLARDVYPSALMKKRAPFVYRWVERMNASDDGFAEFWDLEPELVADDEIPDTLLPVIELFVGDYFPELEMLVDAVNARASQDGMGPGSPVLPEGKNGLGRHVVPYRGVQVHQAIRHFSYYMLQRSMFYYQELAVAQKADVAALLEKVGARGLFERGLKHKMVRDKGAEYFS
ncbi:MAG: glutathione S-transferase family protein [Alphaproteobacteria bacterium]|nr:MAG: glutathione S-transferase family protein [Alphaproteobacteria bacterium]